MKTNIILFILTLLFVVNSVFLSKTIPGNTQFCLMQDIPHRTLVKIQIKTNALVRFQLKQGMVAIFNSQVDNTQLTKSITTQHYGTHHFCFLNREQYSTKIRMQISVGKRANDYGSVRDSQDFIGVLKNQANIAQDFIQQIVKQNTQGLQIMLAEQRDHYNFTNLYIFSGLFAISSIILTCLQYRVIKKHLHARKYI